MQFQLQGWSEIKCYRIDTYSVKKHFWSKIMDLPFIRVSSIPVSEADLALFAYHAIAAVRGSRAVTLGHFRRNLAVDNKAHSGFDPVTEADRACEALIREQLISSLPGHGVFGEEAGYTPGESGLTWVVDPIDGTRSFVCGVPLWGTLVGLSDGQLPVLGVLYQPFSDELFVGSRLGGQVERGGVVEPLRVSAVTKVSDARLFCTSYDIFSAAERAQFDAVSERARLMRMGADCYAYGLLAAGHVDLIVEAGLQCYDVYALIPIVESAGGVITNWSGEDPSRGGTIVAASTPELHAQALDLLQRAAS